MSRYTHRLSWEGKKPEGPLAGLWLDHDYPCLDDATTRRHMALLASQPGVRAVKLRSFTSR